MPIVSKASSLHPGKECGPCKLCLGQKSRYWHVGQAGPESEQLSILLRSRGIEDADCICQTCQRKISRQDCSPTEKRKLDEPCAVDGCAIANVKKVKTSTDNFPSYVLEMFDVQTKEDPSSQLTICKTHYSSMYNLTKRAKCCICYGTKNLRSPGDVDVACKYVTSVLQLEDVDMDSSSKICNTCFQAIQKYSKSANYHHAVNSSTDYFASLVAIHRNCTIETCKSYESYAFSVSMVHLGDELLSDRPVLLSDVYAIYKDICNTHFSMLASTPSTSSASSVDPEEPNRKSQRHFLTSIKVAFGGCIIVSQIQGQPRYGTMIRRTGSSLVNSLHMLLFDRKQDGDRNTESTYQGSKAAYPQSPHRDKVLFSSLSDVATELNKRVLSSSKLILKKDRNEGLRLESFNFKDEILRIDPVVWNFVTALTQGRSDSSSKVFNSNFEWDTHFECQTHLPDAVNDNKFLRRYLIASSLLFTANEQCYTHLHMLLADILDRYTRSSSACFATFSKFGVSVSKSTYLRHQTKVSMNEMMHKESALNKSFCIASIDNIDRNFSYASVSSNSKDRGFHGTSIQAVEPLPMSTAIHPTTSTESDATKTCLSDGKCSTLQNIPLSVVEDFHATTNLFPNLDPTKRAQNPYSSLPISEFQVSESDRAALHTIEGNIFVYMMAKNITQEQFPELVLPDLKNSFSSVVSSPEVSRVHFTSVLQAPADSKDTLLDVLDLLHQKHQIGDITEFRLVAGDGKTYQHLLHLKRMYGDDLEWMLPFIGDWHLLKNSQAPLLKVYLHAGLLDMLSVFHKGATLKAVSKASGFQKTHQFLLQVWESIYRHMLIPFMTHMEFNPDFQQMVQDMQQLITKRKQHLMPALFTSELCHVMSNYYSMFSAFTDDISKCNVTFRFWLNFVKRDMLYYFCLFYSIRSRDFKLRNVSVRLMAPIFHSLDRPMYLRIVPEHLASLKTFPPEVLAHLQAGAFAVSITGQSMSCVALDEAHEMIINKDVKMAMNSAEPAGLTRLVHYLPYRSKVQKNLQRQQTSEADKFQVDASHFKTTEENIRAYMCKLSSSNLFSPGELTSLHHLFSDKVASDAATSDLLSFYLEGEKSFLAYVKCFIIHSSSEPPRRRRRNLQTFSVKAKGQQKHKQELKDHKLQIACLRRQIAFSRQTNTAVSDLSQFVLLPRAICLADGLPYKGNKAISASVYEKTYPSAFSSNLDRSGVASRCFIIDSMFLINNTRPLDGHKTFQDYAGFLFRRWIGDTVTYLKATEIHLVFDHPGRHGSTPKDIERLRRDKAFEDEDSVTEVQSSTPTPGNWSSFLRNRKQKRFLVKYLCNEILRLASTAAICPSKLIVAGGFEDDAIDKAFQYDGTIKEAPEYNANHEEADSRVWLHACRTSCTNIIIYSPDRDILHIGLPLITTDLTNKNVTVQLSCRLKENCYVNMNELVSCFQSDISFQELEEQLPEIGKCIQMLFICSGCDYVSYFKGQTKRIFFKVFQQYCHFITGGTFEGVLFNFHHNSWEKGLLAFYRLIGSVYFVTHAGAFAEESPREVFSKAFREGMTSEQHHVAFVSAIRDGHFHRVSDEAQWMPSPDALRFHWQRCCWTALLWEQATVNFMVPPNVCQHGWEFNEAGNLCVTWDSKENMAKIIDGIRFLKEGCKCRTGCQNRRCKCFKRDSFCGPGCSCFQCENKSQETLSEDRDSGSEFDSDSENDDSDQFDSDIDESFSGDVGGSSVEYGSDNDYPGEDIAGNYDEGLSVLLDE